VQFEARVGDDDDDEHEGGSFFISKPVSTSHHPIDWTCIGGCLNLKDHLRRLLMIMIKL
jgi:hypothetical protein